MSAPPGWERALEFSTREAYTRTLLVEGIGP